MDDEFKELDLLTTAIQESLERCVDLAGEEVERIIQEKQKNVKEIQKLLTFLLGVTQLEMGDHLFVKLLDYYKNIDAEDALDFWQRYDENPQ